MHKIDKALLAAFSVSLLLGTGSVLAADAPAAATAAPAAAPAPAPTAKASAAKAEVVRAQFTSGVDKHEPTDTLTTLDNSHTRIYFYAVLVNMSGQSVTFRWTYNGVTQAEVKQTPNSARYRTYTSKELDPSKLGTWTVDVVDDAGNVLTTKTFEYTKAAAADTTPAPAASTKK